MIITVTVMAIHNKNINHIHPLAYHTSRILDDEIAKSKNLKSNDSLIDELDFNNFNLRDYLRKNYSMLTLKNRIAIFQWLCLSLYRIHEKDLIHCDLHSGNILVQGGNCYITDLGLCGPVDDDESIE